MVANSNKHDIAISLLLESKEISTKFFDYLLDDEYFFQNRMVHLDNFKLMHRRKVFMQMNKSYVSALVPLGEYFEENNEPLLMSEFVLNKGSVYVFSDADMSKVIAWYSNPNVDKDRINLVNEDAIAKGHTPTNHEVYNYPNNSDFA